MKLVGRCNIVCDVCNVIIAFGPVINDLVREPVRPPQASESERNIRWHYEQTGHNRYGKRDELFLVPDALPPGQTPV